MGEKIKDRGGPLKSDLVRRQSGKPQASGNVRTGRSGLPCAAGPSPP